MSLVNDDGFSNDPVNLDFPFINRRNDLPIGVQTRMNYLSIGGICNGLACISLSGYPLILCNPSARKFWEIPNSEWNWLGENSHNCQMYVKRESFGFGFHRSAHDYKLIRIVSYVTTSIQGDVIVSIEDHIRADLYAMSTDTWTEIDVNKLSLVFGKINDVLHDVLIVGCSASAVLNGDPIDPMPCFGDLPSLPRGEWNCRFIS
ncbi:hypothetical protein RHGRI_015416 [Rhododendron griersonianum]|uniref:F-box protein n=1 Tax=Rhododendron griersonianum TaxID=479676 RepID=A0AAV6KDR1_9ERIC|nr:hypothetical protein RHGRI_015416 [Rhododendron griersonianum]